MKLRIAGLVVGVVALYGCAPTPNDVTITSIPGLCVNSQIPGYESQASSVSPNNAYPMNATMPSHSPYCIAYTMTNNNSGKNSNNVQVYQTGLQLTYTVESTSFTAYLQDINAAGLNLNGFVQTVGGITLFDPNNCVTTYGSHVNTLSKGGDQCTFYLQVTSESMPIGNYPVSLSINYTNGNSSYFLNDQFNYHVDLYAGGDFTDHLKVYDGNSNSKAEPFLITPPVNSIKLMARDNIGYIYAYDGTNIYRYDSAGLGSRLELLPEIQGAPIVNQLKADQFGNLFAATSNGIYVYNAYVGFNNAVWSNLSGVGSNESVGAIDLKYINNQNVLFYSATANTTSQIESCVYSYGVSNYNCNSPQVIFESTNGWTANNRALAYNSATESLIFGATENNLSNVYVSSNAYFSPISNFNQNGTIGYDTLGFIYAASNSGTLESAIFSNLTAQFEPLLDESGNSLYGKSNGIHLRSFTLSSISYMNVIAYGDKLSSVSPIRDGYIAYLPMIAGTNSYNTNVFLANSVWLFINGFDDSVNDIVINSRLSNY